MLAVTETTLCVADMGIKKKYDVNFCFHLFIYLFIYLLSLLSSVIS